MGSGPPSSNPKSKEDLTDGDVLIEVHATGSVTSAFSLHVVYEEFYLKNNLIYEKTTKEDGIGIGMVTESRDADLFLVDHAANDLSLRKR